MVPGKTDTPCPDETTLRLVCLGEAPLPLTDQVLEHIERCPACPERIDALWLRAYHHPSTAENSALHPGPRRPAGGRPGPLAALLDRTASRRALDRLKPSPQAEMPGRLGPYDLLRVIGSGGAGIVLEAIDTRDGRPVAVKCLRPSRMGSAEFRDRFLREAATAASIGHPGVPPILDQGVDGGVPYLVMPLLRGADFRELIGREAPLAVDRAIDYLIQVCVILEAAHARGIIHRDIKPSNLWLERSDDGAGRVLLLDFGLATPDGGDSHPTQSGDMIGTPAYLSPEQANGYRQGVTPATDLFSLGAVAYELLTGRRVFPGDSALEIMRNMAHFKFVQPRDLRPGIPWRVNDLVMGLLAWDPAKRPSASQSVAALKNPALLRDPWISRRSALRVAVAGGAFAGLAVLVLALTGLSGFLAAYGWREQNLRRQAEEETARAQALLDNSLRSHLDGARSLLEVSFLLRSAKESPAEAANAIRSSLVANSARLLEGFRRQPELAGQYPRWLAEILYAHLMLAREADHRPAMIRAAGELLEVLATQDSLPDNLLDMEISSALLVGGEWLQTGRAEDAITLWTRVWRARSPLPPSSLLANTFRVTLVESLANQLADALARHQNDPPAAAAVRDRLAQLKSGPKPPG